MPVALEQPQVHYSAQTPRLRRARRVVAVAVRLTILAGVVAIVGGGYYLARRGFGREWRYRVVEELHKRGVEAQIGRLTLDPFRGLVAKHVRIFDYKNRANTLALISEISLDINYAALIHNEPFLNALDVRDAQITFPLRTAEGKISRALLTNFRAHVYVPPEEWQKRLSIVQRVLNELQKFRFPGGPPSLQLTFSGDIAEIEKAHVEATLRGDRLQRGSYEIKYLSSAAEWNNQRLDIAHCEWSDSKGSLAGRADCSRESNTARFQIRSSL